MDICLSAPETPKRSKSMCLHQSSDIDTKLIKQIGNYTLGAEIGSGAFGKVVLGKHTLTGETVAVKILDKMILNQTPEDFELVKQEISILKIVKHKYIVQLYEILQTPQHIFIVMEYCEGKDLMDYILTKTRLTEVESLKFFQQLINALFYLHSQNISHRDVKIDNMLLDRNKDLKLVDFGLSTKYTDDTLLDQPCGTVVYAAPEVLDGNEYHGMLADVWSSGIVLFGMTSGYLPFCDQDDEVNKKHVLEGRIELPDFFSPLLKDLLRHMLDINPITRFTLQDIREHPWFKMDETNLIPGIIIGYNMIPVDENILNLCVTYNTDKDKVENSVRNNKFDPGSALYYLLVRKIAKKGFESVSDLSSDAFIDFILDDANLVQNGGGDTSRKSNLENNPSTIMKNNSIVSHQTNNETNGKIQSTPSISSQNKDLHSTSRHADDLGAAPGFLPHMENTTKKQTKKKNDNRFGNNKKNHNIYDNKLNIHNKNAKDLREKKKINLKEKEKERDLGNTTKGNIITNNNNNNSNKGYKAKKFYAKKSVDTTHNNTYKDKEDKDINGGVDNNKNHKNKYGKKQNIGLSINNEAIKNNNEQKRRINANSAQHRKVNSQTTSKNESLTKDHTNKPNSNKMKQIITKDDKTPNKDDKQIITANTNKDKESNPEIQIKKNDNNNNNNDIITNKENENEDYNRSAQLNKEGSIDMEMIEDMIQKNKNEDKNNICNSNEINNNKEDIENENLNSGDMILPKDEAESIVIKGFPFDNGNENNELKTYKKNYNLASDRTNTVNKTPLKSIKKKDNKESTFSAFQELSNKFKEKYGQNKFKNAPIEKNKKPKIININKPNLNPKDKSKNETIRSTNVNSSKNNNKFIKKNMGGYYGHSCIDISPYENIKAPITTKNKDNFNNNNNNTNNVSVCNAKISDKNISKKHNNANNSICISNNNYKNNPDKSLMIEINVKKQNIKNKNMNNKKPKKSHHISKSTEITNCDDSFNNICDMSQNPGYFYLNNNTNYSNNNKKSVLSSYESNKNKTRKQKVISCIKYYNNNYDLKDSIIEESPYFNYSINKSINHNNHHTNNSQKKNQSSISPVKVLNKTTRNYNKKTTDSVIHVKSISQPSLDFNDTQIINNRLKNSKSNKINLNNYSTTFLNTLNISRSRPNNFKVTNLKKKYSPQEITEISNRLYTTNNHFLKNKALAAEGENNFNSNNNNLFNSNNNNRNNNFQNDNNKKKKDSSMLQSSNKKKKKNYSMSKKNNITAIINLHPRINENNDENNNNNTNVNNTNNNQNQNSQKTKVKNLKGKYFERNKLLYGEDNITSPVNKLSNSINNNSKFGTCFSVPKKPMQIFDPNNSSVSKNKNKTKIRLDFNPRAYGISDNETKQMKKNKLNNSVVIGKTDEKKMTRLKRYLDNGNRKTRHQHLESSVVTYRQKDSNIIRELSYSPKQKYLNEKTRRTRVPWKIQKKGIDEKLTSETIYNKYLYKVNNNNPLKPTGHKKINDNNFRMKRHRERDNYNFNNSTTNNNNTYHDRTLKSIRVEKKNNLNQTTTMHENNFNNYTNIPEIKCINKNSKNTVNKTIIQGNNSSNFNNSSINNNLNNINKEKKFKHKPKCFSNESLPPNSQRVKINNDDLNINTNMNMNMTTCLNNFSDGLNNNLSMGGGTNIHNNNNSNNTNKKNISETIQSVHDVGFRNVKNNKWLINSHHNINNNNLKFTMTNSISASSLSSKKDLNGKSDINVFDLFCFFIANNKISFNDYCSNFVNKLKKNGITVVMLNKFNKIKCTKKSDSCEIEIIQISDEDDNEKKEGGENNNNNQKVFYYQIKNKKGAGINKLLSKIFS